MKFTIKLKLIQDYIRRMSTSIQSIASRVELSGVLISVFDNSIVLEGRNDHLDIRIEESSLTDVKIEGSGKALIRAYMLNEILLRMDGETVTFSKIDDNIITVESNGAKFDLNLLTEENFETASYMEEADEKMKISQKDFQQTVSNVIFAGNEKHSKFIYQGVSFSIDQSKLSATVCDGVRIASYNIPIAHEGILNKIIPISVVRELLKMLPESGEYEFLFKHNKGLVKTGNFVVQFSLIEGTFPNFDKFFDTEIYNKELTIERNVLAKSLDRVSVLSINKLDSSRVGIVLNSESIKLESSEMAVGSADVVIKDFEYKGDEIEISLSPKILFDVLRQAKSDKVNIYLKDKNTTILFRSEKDGLIYLMSPMI